MFYAGQKGSWERANYCLLTEIIYLGAQTIDDLVQHFTGIGIVLRVKRGTQAVAKVLGNALVTKGLFSLTF